MAETASPFTALLADKLLKTTANGKEEVATADALRGKTVALYFSAHWCPPCRGFTPSFASYYNHMQSKGVQLEVVFVSWDNDQASFDEYFNEMPWAALPYSHRNVSEALSKKYKVQGIPTVVILDENANVINANARGNISADPEGVNFPYVPKTLPQLLGNQFVNREGESFGSSQLKGKHLALYFSASWCGPCQRFTPELVKAYEAAKAAGNELEIVFVSGDRSKETYDEYLKKMPWLALPYEAAASANEELSEMYGVEGIPHLVILGPNRGPTRPVVNKDAVSAVASDINGFPWAPKAVVDLSEDINSNGYSINEKAAVIVFYESLPAEEQSKINDALKTLSGEFGKGMVCQGDVCTVTDEPAVIFFTNKEDSDIGERIHKFAKVNDVDGPHVLLLDVPERHTYVHTGPIDESSLRTLINDFQNNKLDLKSF